MAIPTAHAALFRRLHVLKAAVLSMGRACQTPLTTKPLLPPAKPHLPLTAFAEWCLEPLEQRHCTLFDRAPLLMGASHHTSDNAPVRSTAALGVGEA